MNTIIKHIECYVGNCRTIYVKRESCKNISLLAYWALRSTVRDFHTTTDIRKSLGKMKNGPPLELITLWQNADAVCFDVDSTVTTGEGLDDLADFCGSGKEVKEWTKKAMGEGTSFREALHARLQIFKPSKQQIEACLKERPPTLTDGIRELVSKLQYKNKSVYLVSGGFHCFIDPIAQSLNISVKNVFANQLIHNEQGEFLGFDEEQPTSSSGGKPAVVQLLKDKFSYESIVMIGDGMTDLEASPPADLFIGFGGNQVRENVKRKARWFVMDFRELIDHL